MRARSKDAIEREPLFFLGFPRVASKLGIEQIALGGGEPTLFPEFAREFSLECKKQGIMVNMTTNGYNVNERTASYFKDFTLVSFSIDSAKIQSQADLTLILQKMILLKQQDVRIGVNLLLDDAILSNLPAMTALLKKYADHVYYLQMKPSSSDASRRVAQQLLQLRLFSSGILVDDSIQLALHHVESCGRGRNMISINPSGEASYCSFDAPFIKLNNASDLINAVNDHYPREPTTRCPFLHPNVVNSHS